MSRNTVITYTLRYVNDYSDTFEMYVKVNYTKLPWEVDDNYENLLDLTDEWSSDMRVSLDDYTIKNISYGGMIVASFD